MNIVIKLGLLFLFFAVVKSETKYEELRCNLRICGAELLHYDKFSISQLFRKMEVASFCVKNCTPPVVHEFFQGIIFGITKRIPGHCNGEECVEKNRFVALAKCVDEQSWPLLQCSKRLVDLAHIGLVINPEEEKRNTTCGIVAETLQCIEETLQICGEKPFQLVKEILSDFIKIGINAYCHPAYRKEGLLIKSTTVITLSPEEAAKLVGDGTGSTIRPPQYVKGYLRQGNNAYGFPAVSNLCLFSCLLFTIIHILQRKY